MSRRIGLFAQVAALCLWLAACAPTLQQAARRDAAFQGPQLEPGAFVSFDGARLPLTRWEASAEPWAVLIAVHGMDDYANAFHLAARYWAANGVTTLAYDQRGFGRAPGRGLWAPDTLLTRDLRTLTALARARWPHAIIGVVGESLGGAVAIEAFASDDPPPAQRLVLLAPAVWGWSEQPLEYRAALWAADKLAPGKVFTPPDWLVRKVRPTDNAAELEAMSHDPLMLGGARTDALFGLVSTMQRAQDGVVSLRTPTFYLYGANDQIIPRRAALDAASKLPPSARTACYGAGFHLLTRDLQGPVVWKDVLVFLKDPGAPLPSGAPPIQHSVCGKRR